MRLYSHTFFNWANAPHVAPWRGEQSKEYHGPGNAYASSVHFYIVPPGVVVERPKYVIWNSAIGRREGDGDVQIQLWAKSGDDWQTPHNDTSLYTTFRSIKEVTVSGNRNGVSHPMFYLTEREIDMLLAVPCSDGLVIGVRQRSLDGVTLPAWYSSELLVSYG